MVERAEGSQHEESRPQGNEVKSQEGGNGFRVKSRVQEKEVKTREAGDDSSTWKSRRVAA